MVRLTVDYDNESKVWFVKTSDLSGVHAEGETLDNLCSKLPAVVSDLIEANRNQVESRKAGTCYCSFCGKNQSVFICDESSICVPRSWRKNTTTQIRPPNKPTRSG